MEEKYLEQVHFKIEQMSVKGLVDNLKLGI
jgi:hypothetical protein